MHGHTRSACGRFRLDKPVRRTAAATVEQLKKYYASAGWQWPAGRKA